MDALTSAALAIGPAGDWCLTPAHHTLVGAKSRANRLGFAVMLLFFLEARGALAPADCEEGVEALLQRPGA